MKQHGDNGDKSDDRRMHARPRTAMRLLPRSSVPCVVVAICAIRCLPSLNPHPFAARGEGVSHISEPRLTGSERRTARPIFPNPRKTDHGEYIIAIAHHRHSNHLLSTRDQHRILIVVGRQYRWWIAEMNLQEKWTITPRTYPHCHRQRRSIHKTPT